MRGRLALGAVAVPLFAACASLSGLSGGGADADSSHDAGLRTDAGLHTDAAHHDATATDAPTPVNDASGHDARSVDTGAHDAGAGDTATGHDAGPPSGNLLTNPGFEDVAALNCGPGWSPFGGATLSLSMTAHSGKQACLVCTPPDLSGAAGVFQTVPGVIPAGTTIDFAAFVTLPLDGGADGGSVEYAGYTADDAGTTLEPRYANVTPVPFIWSHTSNTIVAPEGSVSVSLGVYRNSGTYECFLVDDTSLQVQP